MSLCYNIGSIDAVTNGCMVQVSATRDEKDPNWTRGELTLKEPEQSKIDVGFIYSDLSPREARILAKQLMDCAREIERDFPTDWVVTVNGMIAYYDEHCAMLCDTEDEVKKLVEECKKEYPEDKWEYRRMTPDEFYAYVGH